MRHIAILSFLLFLSACVSSTSYQSYLDRKGVRVLSNNNFEHCSGYGCQKKTPVKANKEMWIEIDQIFEKKATNAREERKQIALSIGVFEQHVGKLTKTDTDKKGTFDAMGEGQLDCVDESINTTVYISLLERRKLLNFHTLHAPTVRLPMFNRNVTWPHQTALISERKTGEYFVVDSWFHDNGARAEVLPLDQWRSGWKPEDDNIIAMN